MKLFLQVVTFASLAAMIPPAIAAQEVAAPTPAARAAGPLADSLRAFGVRMGDMLRTLDAKGVFATYADPAHFVHIENGNVIAWSQLSAMMREYFSTAKTNPVSVVGEPGVTLIDPDNAVVYVTHHFDATNGRPAHDGVWTGVLHRYPAGWKIVHSHSSDRTPVRR